MLVRDCMTATPVSVGPKETLRGAQEVLAMRRIRHLPIVEGGRLLGMVTDRDLRRAAPSPFNSADVVSVHQTLDSTTVDRMMVRNPITVSPSAPLKDAVKVMVERKFGALPVVDGGMLVGIISQIDVLRLFLRSLP